MDEEDWTRVMVGYLVLLCTWLWDSPRSVKEFLGESANLQVVSRPRLIKLRRLHDSRAHTNSSFSLSPRLPEWMRSFKVSAHSY